MKRNAVLLAAAGLGLWLASLSPGLSEVVSAERATSRAAEFAQALDLPWGEGTTAVLRENVNQARLAEWEVSFHDFATVGVDPKRGIVLSAVDYSAVTEHEELKQPPALEEQAALARAADIIGLAGLKDVAELEEPTVLLHELSPDVYRYIVLWRVLHRGIPFEDARVQVTLSAWDGRLLVLSSGLDIPAPESVGVSVSEEAAVGAALDFAWQLEPQLTPSETETELRIVVPNAYWTRSGLGRAVTDSGSRLARVVAVRDANGRERVFWIDAATGALLGGSESGSAVRHATAAASRSTTSAPAP